MLSLESNSNFYSYLFAFLRLRRDNLTISDQSYYSFTEITVFQVGICCIGFWFFSHFASGFSSEINKHQLFPSHLNERMSIVPIEMSSDHTNAIPNNMHVNALGKLDLFRKLLDGNLYLVLSNVVQFISQHSLANRNNDWTAFVTWNSANFVPNDSLAFDGIRWYSY